MQLMHSEEKLAHQRKTGEQSEWRTSEESGERRLTGTWLQSSENGRRDEYIHIYTVHTYSRMYECLWLHGKTILAYFHFMGFVMELGGNLACLCGMHLDFIPLICSLCIINAFNRGSPSWTYEVLWRWRNYAAMIRSILIS